MSAWRDCATTIPAAISPNANRAQPFVQPTQSGLRYAMIAPNASTVPTKFLCIANGQLGCRRTEVPDRILQRSLNDREPPRSRTP